MTFSFAFSMVAVGMILVIDGAKTMTDSIIYLMEVVQSIAPHKCPTLILFDFIIHVHLH
jgi:hypothetical protein